METARIRNLAKEWFNDNYSMSAIDDDEYWVNVSGGCVEFYKELKRKQADPVVDNCCESIGVDDTSNARAIVVNTLSKCAAAELRYCA